MILSFYPLGNGFEVVIPGDLGKRAFLAQRAALRAAGCTWDRARSRYRVSAERLPDAVAAVRRAGFAAALPEDARQAVEKAFTDRLRGVDSPVPLPAPATYYDHQKRGIRFIRERKNLKRSCVLADDMGLGKTLQALMSLDEGAPALIVCPAVAKNVWSRETNQWRPDLLPTIFMTKKDFRFPRPGEVCIANFALLPATLTDRPAPNTRLIGDEVHFVKELGAQRTRSFRALSDGIREEGGVCTLLSGTPMANRPGELWTVLESADLGKESFGDYDTYRKLFAGKRGPYGSTLWGEPDPEVAQRLATVMLRRTKEDCLDLPPKRHQIIEVDAKIDDDALSKVLQHVSEDATLSAVLNWTTLAALDGLPIEELARARAALALAKLPSAVALLDQIDLESDGQEPVIVFSAHRVPVETIARRQGWAAITGSTSNAERLRIENAFQSGELKGIAATIAAAGTALTLTRAATVVFVDQSWTPVDNTQAEDRAYRIGQKRSVRVLILTTSHPLDRRVNELLLDKRRIISQSIDAVANVLRVE